MGIALRRIVVDTSGPTEEERCQIDALKTLAEIQEDHPVRVLARTLEIKSFKLDPDITTEALGYLKAICRNLTRVETLVYVLAL